MRALPERQRAAVALHYLDDLPVDEIAEILDVTAGTVKTSLFKARQSLARTFQRRGGGLMDTIDELGRRAARTALAEAEAYTDVEAGLARILADEEDVDWNVDGGGRRRGGWFSPRPPRWSPRSRPVSCGRGTIRRRGWCPSRRRT